MPRQHDEPLLIPTLKRQSALIMTQCRLTRVFFVHSLETVNALGGFASANDQQPSCHGVQGPCVPNLQHHNDEVHDIGRSHWHAACHPGPVMSRRTLGCWLSLCQVQQ